MQVLDAHVNSTGVTHHSRQVPVSKGHSRTQAERPALAPLEQAHRDGDPETKRPRAPGARVRAVWRKVRPGRLGVNAKEGIHVLDNMRALERLALVTGGIVGVVVRGNLSGPVATVDGAPFDFDQLNRIAGEKHSGGLGVCDVE